MFNDGMENTLHQIALTFLHSLLSASSFLHFSAPNHFLREDWKSCRIHSWSSGLFSLTNLISEFSRVGRVENKKYSGPCDSRTRNYISSSTWTNRSINWKWLCEEKKNNATYYDGQINNASSMWRWGWAYERNIKGCIGKAILHICLGNFNLQHTN